MTSFPNGPGRLSDRQPVPAMRAGRRYLAIGAAGLAVTAVTAGTTAAGAAPRQAVVNWPFAGGNLADTRDAAAEHIISPSTVSTLKPRWTLTTGGDVSATPTVVNGTVYVPDWAGNLWAV